MFNIIVRKFQYAQHTVTIETGMIARQATSAVIVNMDDTSVLVTVVGQKKIKEKYDFFPLTVHYQEKSYAAGRIPGSFFRREGRLSECETIISRLIDRPIRPLFPDGFINEIQIIATVISINPQINPNVVAMIGASAALSLSGIPFNGPIGAARVGYVANEYILNPTVDELKKSNLDLIVSGTSNAIIMVESKANLLSEEQILDAIIFGHEQQQIVIDNIKSLVTEVGKQQWDWKPPVFNQELMNNIEIRIGEKLNKAYYIFDKTERNTQIELIKEQIINELMKNNENLDIIEINKLFLALEKKIIRNRILNGENRIDGRTKDMIRPLDIRTGILPRIHGSALFTRGETQAFVTVTLGTERDAQIVNKVIGGEYTDNFLFHYNFPPYSVGEIGIIGLPKRREIGHGYLAKRCLLAVMPNQNDFPYTIRIVSEITESNGSSSMASVCGASLALMDAGVPIKHAIAGIAMGLIKDNNNYIILSDILGDEDHLGDMDFKVAGSYNGISALQMDIKIEGITREIIKNALNQAKKARLYILNKMAQIINDPRKEISKFAPRIYILNINPEKIKDLIGKGGSVIKALTEETETIIEIKDNGTIKIAATDSIKAEIAIKRIKEITIEIEIGRIYQGKITRLVDFGAFVSFLCGKEGLVHISQITNKRIKNITDYLQLGQNVLVKVLEIDRQGRIRLSIKEANYFNKQKI